MKEVQREAEYAITYKLVLLAGIHGGSLRTTTGETFPTMYQISLTSVQCIEISKGAAVHLGPYYVWHSAIATQHFVFSSDLV